MPDSNQHQELQRAIEETRQRYGFPDIEKRYPAAMLDTFFLKDAIALLEQLEAAQAEAELKRIETHHANAKRAAIEEQLDTAHARGYREGVRNEHARTKEQLEALREAAERVVAADNQSLAAMGQEGERAMVEMTDALYALRVLLLESNPASEPKEPS